MGLKPEPIEGFPFFGCDAIFKHQEHQRSAHSEDKVSSHPELSWLLRAMRSWAPAMACSVRVRRLRMHVCLCRGFRYCCCVGLSGPPSCFCTVKPNRRPVESSLRTGVNHAMPSPTHLPVARPTTFYRNFPSQYLVLCLSKQVSRLTSTVRGMYPSLIVRSSAS